MKRFCAISNSSCWSSVLIACNCGVRSSSFVCVCFGFVLFLFCFVRFFPPGLTLRGSNVEIHESRQGIVQWRTQLTGLEWLQ